MQRTAGKTDYLLLAYFAIWIVLGLIFLTSASSAVRPGDSYYFIKRQLLFGFVPGIIAFLFFAKFNYQKLKSLAWPIFCGTNLLLLMIFIPGLGQSYGTVSRSWLTILNISFQPAELAKFGLIIFLSARLSLPEKNQDKRLVNLMFTLGCCLFSLLLVILQPDIGTVSILLAVIFSLLYFSGVSLWQLGGLAVIGVLGLVTLIAITPGRSGRVTTFLHPELDPQGKGYQTSQAFLAIGSGGLFGLGLGHSRQKFQYLPEVHADSIFAIIAEEMGFLFALGFVIFLVVIAWRGFSLAKQIHDPFGRLLIVGIISWFLCQSFLNIGAIIGILPLTGLPLPFVSHGGTALMISMAAVGVIVNVSKQG